MPNSFAKIFELPTHQVLFHKDWEEINDEVSYRIEARAYIEGGVQSCAYGYRDEAKRDAKFEELNEEAAATTLNLLLAPFEDR